MGYGDSIAPEEPEEPEEPENVAPQALDDSATTEFETAVTVNVLANDSDSDGALDPSSVTVTDAPDNGSFVVNADGSISYTPDDGFSGDDSFSYTVADDDGGVSNEATVSVTVEEDDTPPPTTGGSEANGQILVNAGTELLRIDVSTDNVQLLDRKEFDIDIVDVAVSPDGEIFAYSPDEFYYRIDFDDGTAERLLNRSFAPVSTIAYSPDGKLLGVDTTSFSSRNTVYEIDTTSGIITRLGRLPGAPPTEIQTVEGDLLLFDGIFPRNNAFLSEVDLDEFELTPIGELVRNPADGVGRLGAYAADDRGNVIGVGSASAVDPPFERGAENLAVVRFDQGEDGLTGRLIGVIDDGADNTLTLLFGAAPLNDNAISRNFSTGMADDVV